MAHSASPSLAGAYRLQSEYIATQERAGRAVAGYKIALNSAAQQEALGASEPVYGRLFNDHLQHDECVVAAREHDLVALEVERVLVFNSDLDGQIQDAGELARLIGAAPLGIEVIRIPPRGGKPTARQLVENNGFIERVALTHPSLCVAGDEGAFHLLVDSQSKASGQIPPLDAHLGAINWLIAELAKSGQKILRGQTVLSGALHEMVFLQPGEVAHLEIDGGRATTITRRTCA